MSLRSFMFVAALCGVALAGVSAYGADWPSYLHDSARSGTTDERLEPPLSRHWTFTPRQSPQPSWPDPVKERIRVTYDLAYHVAVAGDTVYFGSSGSNKVYALDAATGKERWSVFTGGPVRVAPTVWRDRVFVGSDDGWAYCLSAADGKVIWKYRPGPSDRKVIGNGRIVSVWPLRTGMIVEDGIAYFAAGLFPTESVFLCAVRADSGEVVWRNDTLGQEYMYLPHGGSEAFSGLVPEGYLLASATRLYVPTGRNVPAAFDRENGQSVFWKANTIRGGGTYALLTGDLIFSGPDRLAAFEKRKGDMFAQFPGDRLVVTRDFSYLLSADTLAALDRQYAASAAAQMRLRSELSSVKKSLSRLEQEQRALKEKGQDLSDEKLGRLAELTKKRDALADELSQADEAAAKCWKWRAESECPYALILAGSVLYAGGQDLVIAVDATTGEELWRAEIDGKARGLAVANGRLFISSDTGAIYCFAKGDGPVTQKSGPPRNDPAYPRAELASVYDEAAERLVSETGVRKGFCLVLGCGTGRLAFEIARRTDLKILGIEADAKKVAQARRALDAAGLYGTRVTVEQGSWPNVEAPVYFANLVVSDSALVTGRLDGSAGDLQRVLRPSGGVAYIGQPAEGRNADSRLTTSAVRRWLAGADELKGRVIEDGGLWVRIDRGQLPGAGDWTHQYADAGNTTCGADERVQAPLSLLWYGSPGPGRMIDRHSHPAGPLSTGGRLFIPARERVIAVDAYNGTELWDMAVPGALRTNMSRDASNMVATDDYVLRCTGSECWRLDAATGQRTGTYAVPPSPDGTQRDWGYLAWAGDLLFGSATLPASAYERADGIFYSGPTWPALTSDRFFALGLSDGETRWECDGGLIIHKTIAIGDGHVFFIESRGDEALSAGPGQRGPEILEAMFLVGLDADTGKKLWERSVDLKSCGLALMLSYSRGVLVAWGSASQNRVVAFDARDGSTLWEQSFKGGGYAHFHPPAIVGDTVYAEPFAYDIRTGAPRMRVHPVTGEDTPWRFARAYGCGTVSACPAAMFYRSGSMGMYDLKGDAGTSNWGGMRPGCWINIIPAAGLVLAPEGSSGCICSYPIQTSIAFIPSSRNENWSVFHATEKIESVKHLALNLGAPGDQRDADGTLWIAHPRPTTRFGVPLDIIADVLPDGGYFRENSDVVTIRGTDKSWVFASGCVGLTRCVLPLIEDGQDAGVYTVRLGFREHMANRSGWRVFDIKLQGEVVRRDFDVLRAAGGQNTAITRTFDDVKVEDALTIEFVPKVENPTQEQAPLVNFIEVHRR